MLVQPGAERVPVSWHACTCACEALPSSCARDDVPRVSSRDLPFCQVGILQDPTGQQVVTQLQVILSGSFRGSGNEDLIPA